MVSNKILLLLIILLIFSGVHGRSLQDIKRSGVIYVAFTSDDIRSIEHDLALEFARYLNVEMKVVPIEWEEAFMLNGSIPVDIETNPNLRYTVKSGPSEPPLPIFTEPPIPDLKTIG